MNEVTPDDKAIFFEALEQSDPDALAEFLDGRCKGRKCLVGPEIVFFAAVCDEEHQIVMHGWCSTCGLHGWS